VADKNVTNLLIQFNSMTQAHF